MGLVRSSALCIGGSSTEASSSGQTGGESGRLAMVVPQVTSGGPSSPLRKGKGKVSEIRYLGGSKYLRADIQNVEVVGPSRVEPSFKETFVVRYKPPFGVHVWFPNVLTSYVVQVPKVVFFF